MLFTVILSLHYWDKLKSKGHSLLQLPLLSSSGRKEMPSARKYLDGNYCMTKFEQMIPGVPFQPGILWFSTSLVYMIKWCWFLYLLWASFPVPALPLCFFPPSCATCPKLLFSLGKNLFLSHHLSFKGSSALISFSPKSLLNIPYALAGSHCWLWQVHMPGYKVNAWLQVSDGEKVGFHWVVKPFGLWLQIHHPTVKWVGPSSLS